MEISMLPVNRQLKIKEFLVEKGFASVEDLSNIFNVSEMTIRRDLDELHRRGLIQRVYGGAMSNDTAFFEMSVSAKTTQFTSEKERIGLAGAELVNDGDTVLIDSGTTTIEVAKNLKNKNFTLITNALNVAIELSTSPQVEIIVVGGILLKNVQHTVGPQTDAFLKELHVDKAFIGVEGIHPEIGISVPDILDASAKRVMMSIAQQSIIVADHSKIGRKTTSRINPLNKVDLIITDSKADPALLDQIREITEIRII